MTTKKSNYGQQWIPQVQQSVEESFEKRPKGMPSLAVIKQEVAKLGLPETDAEAIYHSWMANGYKNARGHKIMSSHSAIRNWFIHKWFPSQQERLRRGRAMQREERLHQERAPVLPAPDPPASWQPPTKETFLAYCKEKHFTGSHSLKLYRFLVARNWTYYGQKVTSDEQWKAICHTHEFSDR